MGEKNNRQWQIKARPVGPIKEADFDWITAAVPPLDDGQILVRNVYLTLDPGLRHIITEEGSILPPIPLGEVMPGFCVGVVEETRRNDFNPNSGRFVYTTQCI